MVLSCVVVDEGCGRLTNTMQLTRGQNAVTGQPPPSITHHRHWHVVVEASGGVKQLGMQPRAEAAAALVDLDLDCGGLLRCEKP